jgi:hypothetical protein
MSGLDGRIKFTLGLVVVLVFAAIAGWFWFEWLESKGMRDSDSTEEEIVAVPSGALMISYAEEVSDLDAVRLSPFVYSFDTGLMSYWPAEELSGTASGSNLAYHHSFSVHGHWGVFTAVTGLTDTNSPLELGSMPHQIYLADLFNVSTAEEALVRLGEAESVTVGESVKIFPVVSYDGDILYMSHSTASSDAVYLESMAEDWEIHLITSSGETRVVTSGAQPKWLDDNYFIYLKNDGVYLYNLSDSSETPLATTDLAVDVQSRLDITADGKLVAWTEPQLPAVHVFDVEESEGEVILSLKETLAESSGSVVFSPDGKWLALQTPGLNVNDSTDVLNVITVYNLTTMTPLPSPFIFDGADLDTTAITDWVY